MCTWRKIPYCREKHPLRLVLVVGTTLTAPREQTVTRRHVTVNVSAIVTHRLSLLLTVAITVLVDSVDVASVKAYD
jgi:hypothetical protein